MRDAELLREAFTAVASYLRADPDPDGISWLPWFSEYSFEQTRAFRALKLWMALQFHGRAGYAASIARDNRLADRFAELVDAHAGLELVAHNLSIVCLRAVPGDDEHNQAVLRKVQLGGRAFLSSTELDGRFVLRACFINPRTTEADLEIMLEAIASASGARGSP